MRVANGDAKLPANEDSASFLDRISSQPNVSENDAARGILLLMEDKDPAETFQQRLDLLLAKKIACPDWNYDAARPITKGKFAYMIYQACSVPGGVTLSLLGPSQRYCLRELQYRRMMVSGSAFTPITGLEGVGVLTRASVFMETGRVPDKVGHTDG